MCSFQPRWETKKEKQHKDVPDQRQTSSQGENDLCYISRVVVEHAELACIGKIHREGDCNLGFSWNIQYLFFRDFVLPSFFFENSEMPKWHFENL